MVNYEEKVFHPNLGICDVTGIDKKEKRMVITAADGSTCSIPFESLPRVGVRNQPVLRLCRFSRVLWTTSWNSRYSCSLVCCIGNMRKVKKVSVIRNVFPVLRVYSVRSCPLFLTFPRIFLWSVWRIATAAWHRLQKMVQSHFFFIC